MLFEKVFQAAYPGAANEQLILDILEMLFDRGEADGYAEQMTGGLPGTPTTRCCCSAFGDHQVSNYATVTEARTIGAAMHNRPSRRAGSPGTCSGASRRSRRTRPSSRPPCTSDPGVRAPPLADEPPRRVPTNRTRPCPARSRPPSAARDCS